MVVVEGDDGITELAKGEHGLSAYIRGGPDEEKAGSQAAKRNGS